jgi:hypothetical protein
VLPNINFAVPPLRLTSLDWSEEPTRVPYALDYFVIFDGAVEIPLVAARSAANAGTFEKLHLDGYGEYAFALVGFEAEVLPLRSDADLNCGEYDFRIESRVAYWYNVDAGGGEQLVAWNSSEYNALYTTHATASHTYVRAVAIRATIVVVPTGSSNNNGVGDDGEPLDSCVIRLKLRKKRNDVAGITDVFHNDYPVRSDAEAYFSGDYLFMAGTLAAACADMSRMPPLDWPEAYPPQEKCNQNSDIRSWYS